MTMYPPPEMPLMEQEAFLQPDPADYVPTHEASTPFNTFLPYDSAFEDFLSYNLASFNPPPSDMSGTIDPSLLTSSTPSLRRLSSSSGPPSSTISQALSCPETTGFFPLCAEQALLGLSGSATLFSLPTTLPPDFEIPYPIFLPTSRSPPPSPELRDHPPSPRTSRPPHPPPNFEIPTAQPRPPTSPPHPHHLSPAAPAPVRSNQPPPPVRHPPPSGAYRCAHPPAPRSNSSRAPATCASTTGGTASRSSAGTRLRAAGRGRLLEPEG
ncbi:MAG: hypothetical protein FRX48_00889 [Lasallia pustulata]|uniref:Uncharacterized protein n=1 Tax=Lasallia pustulata TaxID=136370 RepID=A0A5M8Q505_9LECA|nr:MAG: hypothetical protein FRX48_00889 [Lasallia pustulata]